MTGVETGAGGGRASWEVASQGLLGRRRLKGRKVALCCKASLCGQSYLSWSWRGEHRALIARPRGSGFVLRTLGNHEGSQAGEE